MSGNRGRGRQGFTIVELLIVIVMIGVLAAIVTIGYSGVQKRALNTARVTELVAWQKIFQSYKAINGVYPPMPAGGYCLGSGFPGGKCRDYQSASTYYTEAGSSSLMTALQAVSVLPAGQRVPVNGTVGPYAIYYGGEDIDLTLVMNGMSSECPPGTAYNWDDGNGRLLCVIKLLNR